MKILECLSVRTVKTALAGRANKQQIIEELVDLLVGEGKVADRQSFVEAIFKREQSVSTAIGEGVAIPHAKAEGIPAPCIAIAICPEGVACDTPDSKPIKVFALIASSPRDAGAQLKILAALSRCIKVPGFLAQFVATQTSQEVMDVFGRFEEVTRL